MILEITKLIGPDVRIVEPDLSLLDPTKRIIQLSICHSDRFDLRAEEFDACLKAITHKKIVRRLGVADFLVTVV